AAVILVLIVLVQNSKGGGLSSGFSSSNQVMGVRKTTDFLEKTTWTLAAVICFLSIVSVGFQGTESDAVEQSMIKEEVENAVKVDPNLTSPNFGAQQAETQAPEATPAPAQAPAKK
ncbi:MAG: preprotein translocase subunit SecG, partial [Bacteroidales bacterium]|nr:preprotein translocase subunit SecG [Bacteroidales bacterium]